jgi:hypothetical protein
MAKKPELPGGEENESQENRLTPELQKSIEDLIYQKKLMARDAEAYGEAVSAVADKLGIKAAVLKKRVTMIIKEEEKGGEVKSTENDIHFTEEYFNIKNNSQFNK